MSAPSFRLKLHRAIDQLETLRSDIKVWIESNPYSVDFDIDQETGEHVLIFRETQTIPDRVLLSVGECIFNMRSGLDHLAFALAVRNGNLGATEEERSAFPISKDKPLDPKTWTNKVGCIDAAPLAIIDSLQPHHTGHLFNDHPLRILDELCNIDKHRRFHVCWLTKATFDWEATNAKVSGVVSPGVTLHDGAELARWLIGFDDPKEKMEVKLNYTFQICFSGPQSVAGKEIVSTLAVISNWIQDNVVKQLQPHLRP